MNKLQDLKTQLENLNYDKLNANSLLADLQAVCQEVDKFFSVEYKTNIDDFAIGKTKLSAKEIQDIQAVFPTPNYLKELLAWKKAGGGTGGSKNKCIICQQLKEVQEFGANSPQVCLSCENTNQKKCKTCGKVQQSGEDFYLATDEKTGQQWYLCEPCKQKWEEEQENNDPLTGKCSVCGNKAYTQLQKGKMISGEKNGVWYCVNHWPQEEKQKCAKCGQEITNSPVNQNGKVYCSQECSKETEREREREREREKRWQVQFW